MPRLRSSQTAQEMWSRMDILRPEHMPRIERLARALDHRRMNRLPHALLRARRPRRFELYGIGLAKSGTHSMASMFSPTFRTQHEADAPEMVDAILDLASDRRSPNEVRAYLARRRQRLNLEVDASQLNAHVLEHLVELSDNAQFVLTVRDPYRWLDSLINHSIARNTSPRWIAFRDLRFGGSRQRHRPEERMLADRGLYTVDGYLGYWHWHVERSLRLVPSERLLVIRTDELSARAIDIVRFAGLSDFVPPAERTHAYRAAGRFGLLNDIDPDYLHNRVTEICGDLVDRLFPDLPHPSELRATLRADEQAAG